MRQYEIRVYTSDNRVDTYGPFELDNPNADTWFVNVDSIGALTISRGFDFRVFAPGKWAAVDRWEVSE